MNKTDQHQAAIGRILQVFYKNSSSDLSFGRRAASTLLLDALFQALNISAIDFYRDPESKNWHAILIEHRLNPAVMTFLLSNGIQPSFGLASAREEESIQWALQNLTEHSVREAVIHF